MKKYLLPIILLLFAFPMNAFSQEESDQEEPELTPAQIEANRLADLMDEAIGTPDAFLYADSILAIEASGNHDISNLCDYAYEQKLINYLIQGKYQEGVDFTSRVGDRQVGVDRMPYLKYLGCLLRIELGHYQMALKEAKELYKRSKDTTMFRECVDTAKYKNIDSVAFSNMAKAQSWALICSGHANREMQEYAKAEQNFIEASNVILQTKDTASFANALDPQTYLMLLSEFFDPQKALNTIKTYEKQLNDFRSYQSEYEALEPIETTDYQLYMYMNYGMTYSKLKDFTRAKAAFVSADSLLSAIGGMSETIMADYYYAKSQYYAATNQSQLSVDYSDSAAVAFRNVMKPAYEVRSLVYAMDGKYKQGKFEQVYPLAKRIIELKDTLTSQTVKSNAADMQTLMGLDKAEKEKAELENQRQILEQRQRFYIMLAVALILIGLLVIFWLRHRATQKEKAILAKQKELLKIQVDEQTKELREQKDTIEAANKSITDSINYALHIQKAILPSFDIYAGNENQPTGAFCFYQPCHIVSGDFYWAAKRGNNTLYACCDCTGHGVPGGFMSMLGTSVLAEATKTPGTENNLAEFLEVAHAQLIQTLEQSGDKDSRDGMDMAVIEYNPENSTISLASANRTSMLFINGEWIQHKGVKRGIGERSLDRNSLPFQCETFEVKKGDRIFLFSDGYPDQFGGPRNKKIGNKGVTAILEQTTDMPFEQLYQFISDKYWEWRGDCEQLDDISMLCVQI